MVTAIHPRDKFIIETDKQKSGTAPTQNC